MKIVNYNINDGVSYYLWDKKNTLMNEKWTLTLLQTFISTAARCPPAQQGALTPSLTSPPSVPPVLSAFWDPRARPNAPLRHTSRVLPTFRRPPTLKTCPASGGHRASTEHGRRPTAQVRNLIFTCCLKGQKYLNKSCSYFLILILLEKYSTGWTSFLK